MSPFTALQLMVDAHILPLSLTISPGTSRLAEAKNCLYSGFLVELRGLWLRVTAGHVAEAIQEAQAEGAVLNTCGFLEFTGSNDAYVPIDILNSLPLSLYQEEGIDIAFYNVSDLVRASLEANGVRPFTLKSIGSCADEYEVY